MTEKRFTVKPLMFVEEQRNGIFEVGGERLFNNEIVGLLNNLADENEQLKQENKELRQYLSWQDMELEEMEDLND